MAQGMCPKLSEVITLVEQRGGKDLERMVGAIRAMLYSTRDTNEAKPRKFLNAVIVRMPEEIAYWEPICAHVTARLRELLELAITMRDRSTRGIKHPLRMVRSMLWKVLGKYDRSVSNEKRTPERGHSRKVSAGLKRRKLREQGRSEHHRSISIYEELCNLVENSEGVKKGKAHEILTRASNDNNPHVVAKFVEAMGYLLTTCPPKITLDQVTGRLNLRSLVRAIEGMEEPALICLMKGLIRLKINDESLTEALVERLTERLPNMREGCLSMITKHGKNLKLSDEIIESAQSNLDEVLQSQESRARATPPIAISA